MMAWHVDRASHEGIVPDGDVDGAQDFLVLQDIADDARLVVRPHPQLRDAVSVPPMRIQQSLELIRLLAPQNLRDVAAFDYQSNGPGERSTVTHRPVHHDDPL